MDVSRWLRSYFQPVCREVLDSYLAEYGFTSLPRDSETTVAYGNGNQHIGFSYWIEDVPHVVMIGLGIGNFDREQGADLADLAKIADDQASYWSWRFNDAENLRQVLTRIRHEVLPKYAVPFWREPALLRAALNRTREAQAAKSLSVRVEKIRQQAADAFQARKFPEVVRLYQGLSAWELSELDRKRLELALKQIKTA